MLATSRGPRILKDGQVLDELVGGTYLLLDGKATIKSMTGGFVRSRDTSALTIAGKRK